MKHIFNDYFEYESLLVKDIVLSSLERNDISLQKKRVLDVGCGEGGILKSLAEHFELEGMGLGYDENLISACRPVKGRSLKRIRKAWLTTYSVAETFKKYWLKILFKRMLIISSDLMKLN